MVATPVQKVTNITAFDLDTLHDADTIASEKQRVVQRVFGTHATYGSLSAAQQDSVEWALDEAALYLTSLARWWTDTDAEQSGSAQHQLSNHWTPLLLVEWTYRLYMNVGSYDQAARYYEVTVQPYRQQIISVFTKNWYSNSVFGGDYTIRSMRYQLMLELIKRPNPVFPSMEEIDRGIVSQYRDLWKSRAWTFRQRPVWFTLETDGSITVDDSLDFELDELFSRYLILKENNSRWSVKQANATVFAEAMAYKVNLTTGLETGRPEIFYPYKQGDDWVLQTIPAPDKVYNGFAVFLIAPPDLSSASDSLSDLPDEFQTALYYKVLYRITGEGSDKARMDEAMEHLPDLDDAGTGDYHFAAMNQDRQFRGAPGYMGNGVIGGGGLGG